MKTKAGSMGHSSKVLELFYERKNFGVLNPIPDGPVWEGRTSNARISMRVMIQVKNNLITEARYQCPTCVVAIAAGSQVTQLVVGMDVNEALNLSAADLADALGGIPAERHDRCSLAVAALRLALEDFQSKRGS